jgi:alpha-mannosidase
MLRLAGIDSFYHMRCSPPAQLYWWQGIDGSRVLAKTGQGYNDQITPSIRRQPQHMPEETPRQLFVYGVATTAAAPPVVTSRPPRAFRKTDSFRRSSSRPPANTSRRAPARRTGHSYTKESSSTFEGCYTSVSRVKQGNRDLENALQTEVLAVVASPLGQTYPADELRRGRYWWKFHDILRIGHPRIECRFGREYQRLSSAVHCDFAP